MVKARYLNLGKLVPAQLLVTYFGFSVQPKYVLLLRTTFIGGLLVGEPLK